MSKNGPRAIAEIEAIETLCRGSTDLIHMVLVERATLQFKELHKQLNSGAAIPIDAPRAKASKPDSSVRRMLRLPEVKATFGIGTTSTYARIADGLLPPPVKLTPKTSCWPEDEIVAVQHALIAGEPDDAIRQLVKKLVEVRRAR